MKVEVKHDISASGRDEGHSLTITKYEHGWSTGELSRANLVQIRDEIDRFLVREQLNLSWLFESDLYATAFGDPESGLLVTDANRRYAVVLSTDNRGRILANGSYYDFGDDFPVILGLFDEVSELGAGEHYLEAAETE